MAFEANGASITSESAPLIQPVDCDGDQDLFMVPLKRPSPRLLPSRYRNVKPRTPPRSPAASSPQQRSDAAKSPHSGDDAHGHRGVRPYQSPPMSGHTVKPDTPPMYASPLMSPESGSAQGRLGSDGSPNPQGSAAQRSMATPGSLAYNSPPMSGRATKAGSSALMSPETGSARQSPQPGSSRNEHATSASRSTGDRASPSTKASSVYDSPPVITHNKPDDAATGEQPQPPEIPAISRARGLRNISQSITNPASRDPNHQTLGLALHLETINPALLVAPPGPSAGGGPSPRSPYNYNTWTVPDSPLERLSQLRATPDSAYDRARHVEVRRSEWKRAVYRFPVRGADHWVVDADLTESSHARLADVARRSADGFEWNGDYELANVYRVLAAAHARVVEEMRAERRGVAAVGGRA